MFQNFILFLIHAQIQSNATKARSNYKYTFTRMPFCNIILCTGSFIFTFESTDFFIPSKR